jgi:hypothetical protein
VGEEFLEVCYKLWESSWEDDAVLRDKENGVFTDPGKVHPIGHKGSIAPLDVTSIRYSRSPARARRQPTMGSTASGATSERTLCTTRLPTSAARSATTI